MKLIDLQMHTTASDGAFSPKEIVDLALKRGMEAIAITDHNTISGIGKAIEHAKGKNIEVISGIEISCREKEFEKIIDIIGLFIDCKNKELNNFTKIIKNNNLSRILNKLLRSPRMKDAIDVIEKAGGVSILAHPARYGNEMNKAIDKFVEAGGRGIEADYPYEKIIGTSNSINERIREIAHEKNLLISGGSDFHDLERSNRIGDGGLTDEEFEKLKQAVKN